MLDIFNLNLKSQQSDGSCLYSTALGKILTGPGTLKQEEPSPDGSDAIESDDQNIFLANLQAWERPVWPVMALSSMIMPLAVNVGE
jgi:hypothetical protein